MAPAAAKRSWANEGIGGSLPGPVHQDKKIKKTQGLQVKPKTRATLQQVQAKRPGGEGITLVRQHLAFEEEEADGCSDQEYQDITSAPSTGSGDAAADGADASQSFSSSSSSSSSEDEGGDEGGVGEAAVSDLDWLRSKAKGTAGVSKATAAQDINCGHATGSGSSSGSGSGSESESESDSASEGEGKGEVGATTPADTAADKGDAVPKFTARLRGLPFSAVDTDVWKFLKNTKTIEVRMTEDRNGRPSGRAFADFACEADLQEALKLDKSHLGDRYIEVCTRVLCSHGHWAMVPDVISSLHNNTQFTHTHAYTAGPLAYTARSPLPQATTNVIAAGLHTMASDG